MTKKLNNIEGISVTEDKKFAIVDLSKWGTTLEKLVEEKLHSVDETLNAALQAGTLTEKEVAHFKVILE